MVVLGSLDYVSEMDELLKIPALLQENQFIRQGSVQLWYQEFMQTVGNDTTVYNNIFPFICRIGLRISFYSIMVNSEKIC